MIQRRYDLRDRARYPHFYESEIGRPFSRSWKTYYSTAVTDNHQRVQVDHNHVFFVLFQETLGIHAVAGAAAADAAAAEAILIGTL